MEEADIEFQVNAAMQEADIANNCSVDDPYLALYYATRALGLPERYAPLTRECAMFITAADDDSALFEENEAR